MKSEKKSFIYEYFLKPIGEFIWETGKFVSFFTLGYFTCTVIPVEKLNEYVYLEKSTSTQCVDTIETKIIFDFDKIKTDFNILKIEENKSENTNDLFKQQNKFSSSEFILNNPNLSIEDKILLEYELGLYEITPEKQKIIDKYNLVKKIGDN